MGSTDGDKRPFRDEVAEALAAGKPIPEFPSFTAGEELTATVAELVESFQKDDKFTRGEALYLTMAVMTQCPGKWPSM